jgi:hypothetical protein
LRSGDFRQRLQDAAAATANRETPNSPKISGEDLPQWMRYFGVEDEE